VKKKNLLLSDLTPASTWEDVETAVWNTAKKIIEDWVRRQRSNPNPFAQYYLYYQRSADGKPGDVGIFEEREVPDGYELASPNRITCLVPHQLIGLVHVIMRKLPILPV